jgi:hypothetical protein
MATPEKGLAGKRAMAAGTSAVKVAGAGDAMGAGKGVVVGTVFGTIGVVSAAEKGWGQERRQRVQAARQEPNP